MSKVSPFISKIDELIYKAFRIKKKVKDAEGKIKNVTDPVKKVLETVNKPTLLKSADRNLLKLLAVAKHWNDFIKTSELLKNNRVLDPGELIEKKTQGSLELLSNVVFRESRSGDDFGLNCSGL